ncbi:MAG: pyridoxamine 5'-phosphate oxidase family protein [Blastocatellia bacterium]|nr:pyridoxamine 5'-phosphate oxidase family protein [Blastocatellia bacterium]
MLNSNFGRIACSQNNQPYIVPFNFVFDGKEHLYAFSTLGQKIIWMRENPLVCIETEKIGSEDNWTTVILFGKYQELSEKLEKDFAYELLANRPKWWKPAYLAGTHREEIEEKPVYFRVSIEKMSGRMVFSGDIETSVKKFAKRPNLKTRGLW